MRVSLTEGLGVIFICAEICRASCRTRKSLFVDAIFAIEIVLKKKLSTSSEHTVRDFGVVFSYEKTKYRRPASSEIDVASLQRFNVLN